MHLLMNLRLGGGMTYRYGQGSSFASWHFAFFQYYNNGGFVAPMIIHFYMLIIINRCGIVVNLVLRSFDS